MSTDHIQNKALAISTMSDSIEERLPGRKHHPLLWIGIAVAAAIAYLLLGTERGKTVIVSTPPEILQTSGEIDRNLLIPPGMRARQYIEQIRTEGYPYPLQQIYTKANDYDREGSLADAHLLYFFGAREGHVDSMIKLAEMSDPNFFKSENTLLDRANPLQSYKWYVKASEQGQSDLSGRIENLQQWAMQESESDNPYARQLLLVVR